MKGTIFQSFSSSPSIFFPPGRIRILGAGHFGLIAARRLWRRYPEAEFLIVDSDQEKLARIREELNLPVRSEDAVSYITREPVEDDVWIIPAVPVHVAFQWILNELNKIGRAQPIPVPGAADTQAPHPLRTPEGTLYASFADFICPDVCSEPDELCTFTREPRRGNLFEHLGGIDIEGYSVVVIRSLQLSPGVGGYPMADLKTALDIISKSAGSYLVATSCRCHGVINAVKWEPVASFAE
jgi:hypothetical protein